MPINHVKKWRRTGFMKRKVAVEQSLTPVRDLLAGKGYTVESIDLNNEFSKGLEKYDAVVVTGLSENFLGVEDINTGAVVISAKGLTAEQVYNQIENRLQ